MIFFGSGTFSGVTIGAPVFLFTFNYLPATYSTPVPLFIAGDGIDLLVSSVTQGFTDATGLHIKGTGWLNEGGFDTTFASFILNSSKSGDAVTFQATTTANPVPEPASLALFGTGLLGVVGIARRKFAV